MIYPVTLQYIFYFFNDTATTEIYTLSLHDALPISRVIRRASDAVACASPPATWSRSAASSWRSEEHTSELQSRGHLVCRLLLEKKKTHFLRLHRCANTEGRS